MQPSDRKAAMVMDINGCIAGYNLAYVGMNHALDAWKKQIARTPSGGSIDVEIVIYIIKRGCKCLIALFLRRPTFTALHA